MKLWMRRIFVAIVTVVTLGMYIPPLEAHPDKDRAKDTENFVDDKYSSAVQVTEEKHDYTVTLDPVDEHLQLLLNKAKQQTQIKLGPRIMTEIEEDVMREIFPKMEALIEDVVQAVGRTKVPYLEITENPSSGIGERIFDVYDHETNSILLKFHVRRVNRPLEGHWFHFHYHVHDDNFENHYDLAEVYWAKNDPPQWMS